MSDYGIVIHMKTFAAIIFLMPLYAFALEDHITLSDYKALPPKESIYHLKGAAHSLARTFAGNFNETVSYAETLLAEHGNSCFTALRNPAHFFTLLLDAQLKKNKKAQNALWLDDSQLTQNISEGAVLINPSLVDLYTEMAAYTLILKNHSEFLDYQLRSEQTDDYATHRLGHLIEKLSSEK